MHTDDVRWTEYVRLQRRLHVHHRADDRAAGYEKALDALLTTDGRAAGLPRSEEVTRVRAAIERNERRRRSLLQREAHVLHDQVRVHADVVPTAALHARIELGRILRIAKPSEVALIVRLARGGDTAVDPTGRAAFRKRLERFRKRLAA
ncbi:hypothetical protein ASF53_11870 [Methylobacterium sp. Leaf123]|uniref:hypothetical protein n=1 Tax=Methylobacterium sp. Leaf123 TaxID=1736264 RepID=UPI0007003871|nr:hypothetical protein [Methylobacterium sp. Leaf123]KQQ13661.1 hypothetical protein ASF53_11870 [Methylobacterium sp. Leaf123]